MKIVKIIFLLLTSQSLLAAQYSGILEYEHGLGLTSPVSGLIHSMAPSGKYYPQGQTLLVFDQTVIQSQIKALSARIKAAKLAQEEARKEFERAQELYDGDMLSDYELRQAELGWLRQQAKRQQLVSEMVQLKWQLKHHQLKAPVAGFIVRHFYHSGQYVQNQFQANVLIQFVAAQDVRLRLRIPSNQFSSQSKINHLNVGDDVLLDDILKAKIVSVFDTGTDKQLLLTLPQMAERPEASHLPLDQSIIRITIP